MNKSKPLVKTSHSPEVVSSNNLSVAWSKILLRVVEYPGTEISPLIISLYGFNEKNEIAECQDLRQSLDQLLASKNKTSIENVAFTIFPERFWRISGRNREKLFDLYRSSFPRIVQMNKSLNSRGLYFQRMTMYGRGPCDGNQLEWIIKQYTGRKGVRRSMLQATVFDAEKDHVASAQLGFPCLQHVSFEPTKNGLVVNAFYATQQLFDKAYGNYLGLAHLGAFMAGELNTNLAQVNIMIGVAKMERIAKKDLELRSLVEKAKKLINDSEVDLHDQVCISQ